MRAADRAMPLSLSPASSADLPGDVATGAAVVASNRRADFIGQGGGMKRLALLLTLAACTPAAPDNPACDRRAPPWDSAQCRGVAR